MYILLLIGYLSYKDCKNSWLKISLSLYIYLCVCVTLLVINKNGETLSLIISSFVLKTRAILYQACLHAYKLTSLSSLLIPSQFVLHVNVMNRSGFLYVLQIAMTSW
jgi:hypothetical protein